MKFPKGQQQPCVQVPSKKQNCGEFGTFIHPDLKHEPGYQMCHGGVFEAEEYDPCPVRHECQLTQIAQRKGRSLPVFNPRTTPLVTPPPAPQPTASMPEFEIPPLKFKLGDFGLPLETTLPAAVQKPLEDAAKSLEDRIREAVDGAVKGALGQTEVVKPKSDLPGMQTPYIAQSGTTAAPPTFLPKPGESTWDRLLKNILQGMLAALGWVIWSYAKAVDLFG